MKGGGCKVRSQLQNTHSRSSYMLYIVSILMDIYRVIKKKGTVTSIALSTTTHYDKHTWSLDKHTS